MSQLRNILMTKQGGIPQPTKLFFDNACFDTGKFFTSSLTKVECKFRSKGVNINSWLFGTRVSNADVDCYTAQLLMGTLASTTNISGTSYNDSIITFHQDIEYEYDGSDIKINGSVWQSPNAGFPVSSHSIYFGAINNNGTITASTAAFSGEFYYFRAYDINGLVWEFIPWLENGQYYVKETVSNILISPYYGTFYGSDPTTHTVLTSCYFNNAAIDTGISIDNTMTSMEISYSYTRSQAGYWCWGCRRTSSAGRCTGQDATSGVSVTFNATKIIAAADKTKRMDCAFDGTTFNITNEGVTNSDTFTGFLSSVYPFCIGRLNNGGSFTATGMQGLFWRCKLVKAGVLVGDFVPVKTNDNTICLYNNATGYYHLLSAGSISENP